MIRTPFSIPRLSVLCLSIGLLACRPEQKNEQPAKPKPITKVVGVARIEPEQGLIQLYAGTTGRVTAISVSENESLKKGQVLLTVDRKTDQAQLASSQAKIGTQRAGIAAQEAAVASLKLSADKARADYELNQQLFAVKGITQKNLTQSAADAAKAQQEYRKGLADLQQTRTVLNELNADVNVYAVQAKEKTLKAPYTGKLLEWTVKVGDYVTGETQVGQMAPEGALTARTEVDELFAERIKLGQKADIRSQATGKLIGTGTVYFAGDFLKKKSLFEDETAQEDRRVREVRIRLNSGEGVFVNARVDCIIHLN
ncbi:HlyD family secretion protein [Larkinella sp. GY13]|uniref:HlyD family secretion protein n=1 Tax=Larkinella sp. GY13 TaxID=3453720 RepID=UPI003EEB4386